MDSSSGIQASLVGRYAAALFALARDAGAIEAVGKSLDDIDAAARDSDTLGALLHSPTVGRADAGKAVQAVAESLTLHPTVTNFLGVLAANGRLSQLTPAIAAYRQMAARHRNEVAAEVVSAHPLADDQLTALKAKLRQRVGADVTLNTKVDPSILGGLVVKIGSTMIDSSIRTRLNTLAHAMKG